MRRKVGLFFVFGAVLPLALASAAWACGVLATLTLDTKVASPGDALTATGKNYSTAAGTSAVTIRLKSRTGEVLTSTAPIAGGRISKTFSLPTSISPGWYVVMATQFNADGTPKSGTPGRTTLRVQGAGSGAAASPWGTPGSSGPGGSAAPAAHGGADSGGQPVLPMMLATALSLSMLAAGWMLVGRKSRRVAGPQLSV